MFPISLLRTARRATPSCRRMRLFALCAGSALIAGFALGQERSHGDVWQRMLQDAYSAHLSRVLAELPPHSGVPPLLDLIHSKQDSSAKDRAWEDKFNGWGTQEITDLGVPGPSEATSIDTTFIDGVGRPSALPARGSQAVVIATVTSASARIAYTHTFVYSRYCLKITKVFKGKSKNGFRKGGEVVAVQFGGRVLFPSGHMASFIMPGHGFLDIGKQYVVFIWTPPHTKTYTIANPYLIQKGVVFPLNIEPDVSAYEKGMPIQEFEARIKAAIAKNVPD